MITEQQLEMISDKLEEIQRMFFDVSKLLSLNETIKTRTDIIAELSDLGSELIMINGKMGFDIMYPFGTDYTEFRNGYRVAFEDILNYLKNGLSFYLSSVLYSIREQRRQEEKGDANNRATTQRVGRD